MRYKPDEDIKTDLREIRKRSWSARLQAISSSLKGWNDWLVVLAVLAMVIIVIANMIINAF